MSNANAMNDGMLSAEIEQVVKDSESNREKIMKNYRKANSRIDALIKLREKGEARTWIYRTYLKMFEITAFAGMFGLFGDDPLVYRRSVWLACLCIGLEFLLVYSDYKLHKRIQNVMEE